MCGVRQVSIVCWVEDVEAERSFPRGRVVSAPNLGSRIRVPLNSRFCLYPKSVSFHRTLYSDMIEILVDRT